MAPARSPSSAATMRTSVRSLGAPSPASAQRGADRVEQQVAGLDQPAADRPRASSRAASRRLPMPSATHQPNVVA